MRNALGSRVAAIKARRRGGESGSWALWVMENGSKFADGGWVSKALLSSGPPPLGREQATLQLVSIPVFLSARLPY